MLRNIKPNNLFFSQKANEQTVTLVDFGFAAYENAEPLEFPNCGTPGFIAPEVINFEPEKSRPYSS